MRFQVSIRLCMFFSVLCATTTMAAPQEAKEKPIIFDEHAERKAMLPKLIDAGILMLEGKAYHQFIYTFIDAENLPRFEANYTKDGVVDYARWGREKAFSVLRLLRGLRGTYPRWEGERACFGIGGMDDKSFSFIYIKDAWYIENHSACPVRHKVEPEKKLPRKVSP